MQMEQCTWGQPFQWNLPFHWNYPRSKGNQVYSRGCCGRGYYCLKPPGRLKCRGRRKNPL